MSRVEFSKDGNMYLRELVTYKETMGSKNHVASDVYDGGLEFSDDHAIVYRKGPWTTEEDALLIKYVKDMGERNWKHVQKTGLMRCGKSCRLRWTNHLKPDLKKGAFSAEEERIVIQLHHKIGNRWSKIASKLPGRTDNGVKNFWNTNIKRRAVFPSRESFEENSSSTQQTTFSLTNSNHKSSLETQINRLTCSTIHEDSMISFTNKSSYKLDFLVEEGHPSLINNPNANTFPLTNTNVSSCFYTQQNLSEYVKNDSLSFESEITMEVQEKEVTSIWTRTENDSNYCYLGSSKMEVTSEEKSLEEKMESIEDDLSNLLNTFTSDEPRLELDFKTGGDNTMPTYHHFYLDQKVVFPSFSEDMIPTTSDSNAPGSISSEIVECFNEEDWINTPEST